MENQCSNNCPSDQKTSWRKKLALVLYIVIALVVFRGGEAAYRYFAEKKAESDKQAEYVRRRDESWRKEIEGMENRPNIDGDPLKLERIARLRGTNSAEYVQARINWLRNDAMEFLKEAREDQRYAQEALTNNRIFCDFITYSEDHKLVSVHVNCDGRTKGSGYVKRSELSEPLSLTYPKCLTEGEARYVWKTYCSYNRYHIFEKINAVKEEIKDLESRLAILTGGKKDGEKVKED